MSYTIVGVIGHIDHGKTSLVAALSGIDTDTHPEEKRRGITIDLGFAAFTANDHQFALIDAPGHQKYIGNLLAGVARIDVGLLVVACDQGIQEQTLEHASILQTLGVQRLVVALSRIDLVSESDQAALREELELFLNDYGFTDFPIVPVSPPQNIGIDQLKVTLCTLADTIETKPSGSYFRMPIDRVFTMPGRGCVLAGTVWSGQVQVGDHLQLANSRTPVRVREVEVHGESVDVSNTGYRTALNVTGVSASEVQRGDELVASDAFATTKHLLVEIQTTAAAPEIRCPATVQMHLAASTCSAKITGIRRLQPSQSAVVVVQTSLPVVATFGQKCLFRLPYPVGTIGGGTMLAALTADTKKNRRLIELGETLAMADPAERLQAWVRFLTEVEPKPAWLELELGIPCGTAQQRAVQQAIASGTVIQLPQTSRLTATQSLERIRQHVVAVLSKQAEETRDAWRVEESVVQQSRSFGSPELIHRAIQQLIDAGTVVRLGRNIAVASDENTMSKKQQARLEKVVAAFEANRSPPSLKELCDQLQLPLETVTSLTRFGVQTGMLLDTGNGLLLSANVFRDMCAELRELFQQKPELTAAEIKDHWQVTRKHAIPFLEYCDRECITIRKDNVRVAGPAFAIQDK